MNWRDMDTAPRTGDRFWGKVGDDAIAMLWHEGFKAFVSGWSRMTMARGLTINGEPYKDHSPQGCRPEAWMPMPAEADDQTAAFLAECDQVEREEFARLRQERDDYRLAAQVEAGERRRAHAEVAVARRRLSDAAEDHVPNFRGYCRATLALMDEAAAMKSESAHA